MAATQRAPHLNDAFYTRIIAHRLGMIPQHVANLDHPQATPPYRKLQAYSAFRQDLELLITRYSAGEDVKALRDQLPSVIQSLGLYVKHKGGAYLIDEQKLDSYSHGLWLVSLAQLLDATDAQWDVLLAHLGSTGKDAVFDRLVALRSPGVKPTATLLHAKAYKSLIDGLDAQGPKQAAALGKFIDGWYKAMKNAYWHENHHGNDPAFFGYWCFELAAFVKGLGLDESSFAQHANYPRDLARR
jgi:hypothetical protein